jgi:hypothetical protein
MATVVSNADVPNKIKNRQEFRNSSRPVDGASPWSGRPGGADSLGYLPHRYHDSARSALYVVYSYATPIGWITREGETRVPDVGYTTTTGQQQHATAAAWGMQFWPARGRETVKVRRNHQSSGSSSWQR